MKRLQIRRKQEDKGQRDFSYTVNAESLSERISEQSRRLHLLYGVPLSCLIPDPSFLPEESIRFFYLDENFIQAMLNGMIGVSMQSVTEQQCNRVILPALSQSARKNAYRIRRKKVHNNHKKFRSAVGAAPVRTGFLWRSSLVIYRKGLSFGAWEGTKELAIARLDRIAPDIMLGIFDGVMDRLTITEPKCGLRFGCHDDKRQNPVLSLRHPGSPLEGKLYEVRTNGKGRMDVLDAARQIEQALKAAGELKADEAGREMETGEVGSAVFACQMLLAAQRAEFLKKKEEDL